MARKPVLTDESFLASVFRPKANPTPAGLRHRSVVRTTGRTAARVRAFNKMDAAKQAILDRTGTRESYLRGQSTLASAKKTLRETAVRLGIVKPVRPRGRAAAPAVVNRDTTTQHYVHMRTGLPLEVEVGRSAIRMKLAAFPKAKTDRLLRMSAQEIRERARMHEEEYETADGETIGLYWYR